MWKIIFRGSEYGFHVSGNFVGISFDGFKLIQGWNLLWLPVKCTELLLIVNECIEKQRYIRNFFRSRVKHKIRWNNRGTNIYVYLPLRLVMLMSCTTLVPLCPYDIPVELLPVARGICLQLAGHRMRLRSRGVCYGRRALSTEECLEDCRSDEGSHGDKGTKDNYWQ